MSGSILCPCVGYWDIASSSRGNEKKYKRGKPETQGEWKLSPHLEISENYPKNILYLLDEYPGPVDPVLFFWMTIDWDIYTNLHFLLLQLSVLVNTE